MADYREISQEYAQGAIKAVILVNGGTAVAILSQIGALSALANPKSIASAALVACVGVFFGLCAWILGFASTRHVDRVERGQDEDYTLTDNCMIVGVICVALSALASIVAPIVIVGSL